MNPPDESKPTKADTSEDEAKLTRAQRHLKSYWDQRVNMCTEDGIFRNISKAEELDALGIIDIENPDDYPGAKPKTNESK